MNLARRKAPAPVTQVVALCLLIMVAAGAVNATDATTRKQSRQLLRKANEEIAVGQPEAALANLEAILVADPTNPDAHYLMGKVRLAQNNVSGAEEILAQGMALAPLSSRIKLLLARVKLVQAAPDEAEILVNEVLTMKPHDTEALFLSGSVALARADTTNTLLHWHEALAIELGDERP